MILTEKPVAASTPATQSENHFGQPFPALPSPPLPTPDTSVRICPPNLAVVLGSSDHAIVLSQIHYWMTNPNAGYLKRGRKWVWFSYKTLQLQLPWLSVSRIGRIIRDLEAWKTLFSTNEFNTTTYNRTKWYSVFYETLWNHFGYDPWSPEVMPPQTLENSAANDPSFRIERHNKYYPQTKPHNTNNNDVAFLNNVKDETSGTSTGTVGEELEKECRPGNEPVVEPARVEKVVDADAARNRSKPVARNVEPPPKPKFEFPKLKKREQAKPETPSNGDKEEIDRVLDDAGLASPKLKAFALKYSLDEVQKALTMLRKQGDAIQNAAGWLTNCLKGRWWKSSERRQKAPPAKPWSAEFAPWYAWAISEGIVEDFPVRNLATDYRGEPIVRLAQPDLLMRAPYTCESWRRAMEMFPMPSGIRNSQETGGRGDGGTGREDSQLPTPNSVGVACAKRILRTPNSLLPITDSLLPSSIPNSELRIPNSPLLQDASLADGDDRLRNRPVENNDCLPSDEPSDALPGNVSREISPDRSPAPPSHIAQNHPSESVTQNSSLDNPSDSSDKSPDLPSPSSESVTDNELSGSPPNDTVSGSVSRKVALDFHDPDWMTFPWEPKNGWSPGANRERLLRQKAEWCRNQLLRVSSDEEMHGLFEKLGDCALSCLEWVERHLLTPQDIASRHARQAAHRQYHQRSLLGDSPGFQLGTEPMG